MSLYQSKVPPFKFRKGFAVSAWICLVLALVIVSVAGTHSAQAEEPTASTPTWQGVLALQLKDEYRCDLDKVLFDRDLDAGGRSSKEGRIRCLDGREFDFSRPSTHEKFDLHLCQPTVC